MPEAKLDLTDELLVAYVDGELDPAQRAMVGAVLDGNPVLSRRADELRLARDLLREAFPLQPDASVSPGIETAADRLATACARHASPPRRAPGFRYRRSHAIAAGFVLCGLAALSYVVLRDTGRLRVENVTALTRIDPGNPLYDVLESTASAELINLPKQDAAVRAILTFRTTDGRFCREFEIIADSGDSTGVACREQGGWHVEVLASTTVNPHGLDSYAPAGESDVPAVADAVERLIRGEPLSAREESHALAGDWRVPTPKDP